MIKKYFNILFVINVFLLMFSSCSGDKMTLSDLAVSIQDSIKQVEGQFAVAYIDLNTGDKMMINATENFHAASTMKTPVMIEVFKQAEQGKFSLQDSILLKNEFKSIVDSSLYSMDIGEDSGDSLYQFLGKNRTIYQLVYEMITVSSNLATNILIDLVGAQNVMSTMKELGANDIQVLRGVEDIKAYRLDMNNTTTAYDLALIFQAIAQHKVVSAKACDEMIKILLDQKHNDIIPPLLPDSIKVAHKTGWITGVIHDSGIVYIDENNKYVLVLLSKEVKDEQAARELLRIISKMIYDLKVSSN